MSLNIYEFFYGNTFLDNSDFLWIAWMWTCTWLVLVELSTCVVFYLVLWILQMYIFSIKYYFLIFISTADRLSCAIRIPLFCHCCCSCCGCHRQMLTFSGYKTFSIVSSKESLLQKCHENPINKKLRYVTKCAVLKLA